MKHLTKQMKTILSEYMQVVMTCEYLVTMTLKQKINST